MKRFLTRRAQARTRQNYDYRVLIERTGATRSTKLPLGKYTAVADVAAEGCWVILEKFTAISRINVSYWRHRRELSGRTSRATVALIVARRTTRRGRMARRRGEKRAGGGGEDGDVEGNGLEAGSSSGSDSGDGEGADREGKRNDDEEGRKDWGGSGLDGEDDSDLGDNSFSDSSVSEVKGEGGQRVPDGSTGNQHSREAKGRKRKRSNLVAEHVSSGPVPTSKKSTRGRGRTPNVRVRDQ